MAGGLVCLAAGSPANSGCALDKLSVFLGLTNQQVR